VVALELAGAKDPAQERAKLEKEMDRLKLDLESLNARLCNPDFLAKAAPKAIEAQKRLAEEKGARMKAVQGLLGGQGDGR